MCSPNCQQGPLSVPLECTLDLQARLVDDRSRVTQHLCTTHTQACQIIQPHACIPTTAPLRSWLYFKLLESPALQATLAGTPAQIA